MDATLVVFFVAYLLSCGYVAAHVWYQVKPGTARERLFTVGVILLWPAIYCGVQLARWERSGRKQL